MMPDRPPPWFTGRIINCAGRDALVAALLAGNPSAIRVAIAALPRDLPPTACKALRDVVIRKLFAHVRAGYPDLKPYTVARLLAAAGARLSVPGASLDGPPFNVLDPDDAELIRAEVCSVITYVRWLKWRRILEVVENDVCGFSD